MHDPLAIAAAIDPTLIDTTAVAVDVETAGTLTQRHDGGGLARRMARKPNAQVATGVRAERMIEQFRRGDGEAGATVSVPLREHRVIAHRDVAHRRVLLDRRANGPSGGRK